MKKQCVALFGLSFLLACPVVTTCADTGDSQSRLPGGMAMLEETVTRLKGIHDIRDVSPDDRRRLFDDIDKALRLAQAGCSIDLRKYMESILVCLDALSSCDLGDRDSQEVVGQRIVLECLSMADAFPVYLEFRLVMHIGIGPAQTIDSKGQKAIGDRWRYLRNRLLERRFHLWRRITDQIDPLWDPKDTPVRNVMPPGPEVTSGMAPESVADPKLRAQYSAAIEANRKKTEAYNQQSDARSLRDRYLPQLKAAISDAYAIGPVTEDDLDLLKAYLRIYVADEKLRKEFFEIAHTAAESKHIKTTKPSGGAAE